MGHSYPEALPAGEVLGPARLTVLGTCLSFIRLIALASPRV